MNRAREVDPVFLDFQGAVAGRYSIDRELGRGGMGIVFLAREVQLDRPVAIKLLPPVRAEDPVLRERFLREARLAAKLSHPNIIPIFAVDEIDGFVFYVMAYVDGESLGERVRSRGPLAASEAARVLREVAWALGHAHEHGVVHRDVKPDNIMLEAGSGRALVTDFGIAAAIGATDGDDLAGTPEFMSPEQALNGDVDARSDLYGLGATAFYVCAGRLPFEGRGAVEVLAKQVTAPVPALSALGVPVPRRLAHVIERCLAKDPAQRPASAQALAEQFELSVEQRREVPAALRAFVKRDGRLSGPLVVFLGYSTLGISIPLMVGEGVAIGLSVLAATVLALPFSFFVYAARRIARRGFTHADIGMAFQSDIAQLQEEFEVAGGRERKGLEKWLGVTAIASGAAGVGLALAAPVFTGPGAGPLRSGVASVLVSVFGLAALARILLRARRPQSTSESWARLWMGRVGRAAFAVARVLGGRPKGGAAMTHRATEMAIGMAAEELFETLPRETRLSLGDVPAVLAKLQRDAQELRTHHEKLQEALSDVGEAASGDEYAELRAFRDELGLRLRDVVGALETIRLNLLRLHAGAMTVDGITASFGLADGVSAEVRRLLEARGEIERFLRLPAAIRNTPA